jgi:hypothetical protein
MLRQEAMHVLLTAKVALRDAVTRPSKPTRQADLVLRLEKGQANQLALQSGAVPEPKKRKTLENRTLKMGFKSATGWSPDMIFRSVFGHLVASPFQFSRLPVNSSLRESSEFEYQNVRSA